MATGDDAEAPNLATTSRSTRISRRGQMPLLFPNRADYVRELRSQGLLNDEADLHTNPELVWAIHEHWHQSGQNGCKFAQMLSQAPREHGWKRAVAIYRGEATWLRGILPDIEALT